MSDGLADCADKSDEGRYCQLSLHGAADLDCCRLKGTCFKTETLKSQNLDQDQSCEDQDRDRDGDFANSVSRRSQNQDSSLENSKPASDKARVDAIESCLSVCLCIRNVNFNEHLKCHCN